MKILVLLTSLFLASCGDTIHITEKTEVKDTFQGYFLLNGGSDSNCIYLSRKESGLVDIELDCQSLVTVNPENGTLGQFPKLSARNLPVIKDKIIYTRNFNYNSGNDIEQDISGSNITGKKRTDIIITYDGGKLHISIKIYSNADNNNINQIIAERIFKEM